MMHHASILAALTISELEAAAELGLDTASIAAEAGLESDWLEDPDSRVPLPAYLRMWEILSQRVDGLALGERIGLAGVGGVAFAMRHGATVGDAIDWLQRYGGVVHPDVTPHIEHRREPAGARFVFVHDVPPPFLRLRAPVYAYAAALQATMRSLSGREVHAVFVTFPLSRPADPDPFERFFAAPVAWGGSAVEVAFDAALLDLSIPGSDPRLFRYLTRRADELSTRVPVEDTYTARVRREIGMQLAQGPPRLAAVAGAMAVSERTLHRRLAGEGTNFASLVDDVRRERALLLVENRSVSCSEIAFMLGYADPTAFFRAFKRWTGVTPQLHRSNAGSRRGR